MGSLSFKENEMDKGAKVTIGNTTETIGDAHEEYMQGMKDILNRADSNSPQFPKEETHEEHVTKVAGGVGIVMNYTSVLTQRIEDLEAQNEYYAQGIVKLNDALQTLRRTRKLTNIQVIN